MNVSFYQEQTFIRWDFLLSQWLFMAAGSRHKQNTALSPRL